MASQLARPVSGIDMDKGQRLDTNKATHKPQVPAWRKNSGNDQRQSIWRLMMLKDQSGGA